MTAAERLTSEEGIKHRGRRCIRSVAETIALLVSEKIKSITGQNIHIDNGTI